MSFSQVWKASQSLGTESKYYLRYRRKSQSQKSSGRGLLRPSHKWSMVPPGRSIIYSGWPIVQHPPSSPLSTSSPPPSARGGDSRTRRRIEHEPAAPVSRAPGAAPSKQPPSHPPPVPDWCSPADPQPPTGAPPPTPAADWCSSNGLPLAPTHESHPLTPPPPFLGRRLDA